MTRRSPRPPSGDPDRRPSAAEARAAEEARRTEARAAIEERFTARDGDRRPGRAVVVGDTVASAVLTVTAAAAAAAPEQFVAVYFVVACVCFLAGGALFAAAMVVAAGRSRTDAIGIGGLFFMAGSAPGWARRQLLGLLAAQVVVAVAAAAVRPFTPLAFGTLAPMLGLGCCGLWTARHGLFPPRDRGPAGRAA